MARNEGQGKTIAIVVLFVLMVVGFSGSYYFWNENDQSKQAASTALQNENRAKSAQKAAETNYEQIRTRSIGPSGAGDHSAAVTLIDQELQNPKMSPERIANKVKYETYSTALVYLQDALAQADGDIKSLQGQKEALETELKAIRAKYDGEINVAKVAQQKAVEDLAEASSKLQAIIDAQEKRNLDVTQRYGEQRSRADQAVRDREEAVRKLNTDIARLQANVDRLKELANLQDRLKFEHSDGGITQVLAGGNVAVVDIGQADGLRTGTSFGIYGRDEGGNPYQLPKANLEIDRIDGPHRAHGRITNYDIGHPVISGDTLYNPVWSRGEHESIAFVGLIYMDDDNDPDNEQFKRLIESTGGTIDAEFNPDTELIRGEITPNTGWLVLGEIPKVDENSLNSDTVHLNSVLTDATSKLRGEADGSGVRVINYRNFLTYMGKSMPQRTVVGGQEDRFLNRRPRPRLIDKSIEEAAGAK